MTGVLYPVVITGLAQLLFPVQANGSLIVRDGSPVGSALIGQAFDDPRYFWGRPSVTVPFPIHCDPLVQLPTWGQSNPELVKTVRERIAALHAADPDNRQPVPVDLVTASGSGLDPHISPAAALYQVPRVAKARGLEEEDGREVWSWPTSDGRDFGFLGRAQSSRSSS